MKKILLLMVLVAMQMFLGCKQTSPIAPINNLPDTTTHFFKWNIDTIGIYPSKVNGIWGIDQDNVFAVGFIIYSMQPYVFSGIIHWDGKNWSSVNYKEGELYGIYGFGPSDIWAVGEWGIDNNSYALISHWDGKTWTTTKYREFSRLTTIWGTDSKNIYALGRGGLLLHYNGFTWSKVSIGTNMTLTDICGSDKNNIYITASDNSSGNGALYYFNGTNWKLIVNGTPNINDTLNLYGTFDGVWLSPKRKVFLVGALAYEGLSENWETSEIPYNSPGSNFIGLTAMNKVCGTADNNVFIVGDRELIIHWNGNNWLILNQFFSKSKESSLRAIWVNKKNVFIGGYINNLNSSIIYRGEQE